MLFPIQCNDDGYFSSPPHLACKSPIFQRHSPVLTLPTARVIHIPLAQHAGLSLAGWTRPSLGRQHTLPNNPEVCEIALGMAELRCSKFILPSIALMHLLCRPSFDSCRADSHEQLISNAGWSIIYCVLKVDLHFI